jgi:hypothetical protein
MSKIFPVRSGSYVRGSAAASVIPCGADWSHQDRRRLLRVAAYECGLDLIPRWLRGEEGRPLRSAEDDRGT